MWDLLAGTLFILSYSVGAGVTAFIGHHREGWRDRCGQVSEVTILTMLIWPLFFPAYCTYKLLYSRTEEYHQKKLEETKRKLKEAEEELEQLTSDA